LYFLEAVKPSAVDTAAFLSDFVPGIWADKVARPKRPASALARPNSVNHTRFPAAGFLKEYTIFGCRVFDNRCPKTDALQELTPQLLWCHLKKIRDYLNLRPGDPYIPFAWPGAASPALHALKMQPGNIPQSFPL
jgi:hypothetical protein